MGFTCVEGENDVRRSAAEPAFVFKAADKAVVSAGIRRRLPSGGCDSLGRRVRDFFDGLPQGPEPRLLVGMIPFERTRPDHLFQPNRLAPDLLVGRGLARPAGGAWTERPEPELDRFAASVERALALIAQTDLEKVVLSRSTVLTSNAEFDVLDLVAALLGDPEAVPFAAPLPDRPDGRSGAMVGATPELLIARSGPNIASRPLAGSARKHADPGESDEAARRLMRSAKDRREHAFVAEAILDTLAPYCSQLTAPKQPVMLATRTMWHLATPIEGRLAQPEETSCTDLLAALHPTPAVAGSPRGAAIDAIRDLEAYDRGFYAGAVGWTDAQGDGAWNICLRCAEVIGRSIRLFAGAGIVAGSDPAAETAETSAKLRTMLQAIDRAEAEPQRAVGMP